MDTNILYPEEVSDVGVVDGDEDTLDKEDKDVLGESFMITDVDVALKKEAEETQKAEKDTYILSHVLKPLPLSHRNLHII